MLNLMKNELIKLLKKKSFYVVTIIFVFFCILTNVVYKSMPDLVVEEEINVEDLMSENEELDLSNNEDLLVYVENLTRIRLEELKSEYPTNTEEYLIENNLYSTIYNMYEAEYILEDEGLTEEYQLELETLMSHLDDWEYFLNERITYLETRISETSGLEQDRYEKLLEYANYRESNHVAYDADNYLHQALSYLEENNYEYINLLNDGDLTQEEQSRLEYLQEEMSLREYILETKEDIINDSTLRAVFMNFSSEFGLFILIYVIMLAGSIVSEEYSRGTIKYLLTKPHKRSTILTSKLLVVLLLIPVIMLFMSVIELVIGGIILGFDSLSVPVVLYVNGGIQTYSVLGYLASMLLSTLPIYVILGILAFLISTITASTSAAITISFLFYLLGNVISNLALMYDLKIFKACISLYWDFSYLVLNTTNPYGVSIINSCIVIAIYLFVMLCIAYVYFNKKDVKNV